MPDLHLLYIDIFGDHITWSHSFRLSNSTHDVQFSRRILFNDGHVSPKGKTPVLSCDLEFSWSHIALSFTVLSCPVLRTQATITYFTALLSNNVAKTTVTEVG